MLTASREIYERIPADIRHYLETERRISGAGGRPQMFGLGASVQNDPRDLPANILLFAAEPDDMLSWNTDWGGGVISFRISPEDLAARN